MSQSNEYLKRLVGFAQKEQILRKGEKLLLAVSAGADSTAMLYLYSRLRFSYNLSLLAVHINHQLRGIASDQDEEQIKKLCLQLNVPLIIRHIELKGPQDLENRARIARFEIFNQILESYKFDKVLLAHHKADLAETVLINLLRGSGLSGMAGIKPLQDKVVHPMLDFMPQELKELLNSVKITWREDESNSDPGFTRNRIRTELIPQLKQIYNPQITQLLANEASVLLQADKYIEEKANRRFKKICLENSLERIILSLPDLLRVPQIEQYYILRKAYRLVSGTKQDFFRVHMHELESLFETEGSKHISLPHSIYAIKQYQELIFSSVREDIEPQPAEELIIEGERARAVHINYRFSFKYLKVLPPDCAEYQRNKVILDADKIVGRIRIRTRREGDRFIPFGMNGFKKLKDFFIDEKIPKYDRDLIPIFEDEEKIIWLCGFRPDNRVRYQETSSRYLAIEAESLLKKPNRAANRKKRGSNEFDEL